MDMQGILLSIVSALVVTVTSLCVYIYLDHKASIEEALQTDQRIIETGRKKFNEVDKTLILKEFGLSEKMHDTRDALLEKIYSESRSTNDKINSLNLGLVKVDKNYELLANKIDNLSIQYGNLMSKFDDHEQRISLLESGMRAIAKKKGFNLVSWEN